MKGNYIITTDGYFFAPNGKQYRAAWGNVEIIEDTFLGVKTNRNSANWFAKIGTENNHVIVAGCQIHYAVKCDDRPNDGVAEESTWDASSGLKVFERPSLIYIAD